MMFRSDVSLNSPKGSAAVIDKGYTDYGWYKQLTENEIIFVISQRANVKCRLIERLILRLLQANLFSKMG